MKPMVRAGSLLGQSHVLKLKGILRAKNGGLTKFCKSVACNSI